MGFQHREGPVDIGSHTQPKSYLQLIPIGKGKIDQFFNGVSLGLSKNYILGKTTSSLEAVGQHKRSRYHGLVWGIILFKHILIFYLFTLILIFKACLVCLFINLF